jgi:hypothetical protein
MRAASEKMEAKVNIRKQQESVLKGAKILRRL